MTDPGLAALLSEIRACRLCAAHLPLGPRPVVVARPGARLLIIGQAPGTKVHATGIPWNDRSGDRLRDWLGLDRETFYTHPAIAIMPMGFCYPGRAENGGDNPPRPECAPTWHAKLLDRLPGIETTLLVGSYAQARYPKPGASRLTMTARTAAWADEAPAVFPTPHPSWRTTHWEKMNPWFQQALVPALRARVRDLLR
jgi:uracil-DNA glycosylase